MYLGRWRTEVGDGSRLLGPLEGFRDVCTRWVVNHDLAEWKDEIAWMSLYFSAAVWASLALCVVYSVEDYLPRHRSDVTVISRSSAAPPDNRHFRDLPVTGHATDVPKSTRMTP
jgi:hypothetical protein